MKAFQRTESHLCVFAVEYGGEGMSLHIKQFKRVGLQGFGAVQVGTSL